MFGAHYFCRRYFADRYWPDGAVSVSSGGAGDSGSAAVAPFFRGTSIAPWGPVEVPREAPQWYVVRLRTLRGTLPADPPKRKAPARLPSAPMQAVLTGFRVQIRARMASVTARHGISESLSGPRVAYVHWLRECDRALLARDWKALDRAEREVMEIVGR